MLLQLQKQLVFMTMTTIRVKRPHPTLEKGGRVGWGGGGWGGDEDFAGN
jgi:hypothetical protein